MKTNALKTPLIMLLCACVAFVCVPAPVFSQEESKPAESKEQTLNLITGDLETIVTKNLTRVSVTDPEVADITDAKTDKALILAKKPGQTAVFLWDDDGKRGITIHVSNEELKTLKERVRNAIKEAEIKGVNIETNPMEGKVVLSGAISRADKAMLEKAMEPYTGNVINLTKEEVIEDLVQVDMQITELSATLDKKLGIDWTQALDYTESGIPMTGGSKNWFKFGQFNRTTAIVDTINLLINEGKARDLSRPRIMVSSGKEATINVGGQVPIKSTTTNATGGSSQENVTFKQYGVTLTVTPTVKGGKIDVVMNVQVSDIDKTFPVQASTTNDIAYKTRSAQTYLLLDDRQTVVFAGLIRYNDSEQVKGVPILGKLPVVGALFRNRSKNAPDEGKELVITLTPTIVRKKEYAADQVKMPTQALKDFEKEVDQKQGYAREPLAGTDNAVTMPPAAPKAADPAVKQPAAKPDVSSCASGGPACRQAGLTPYVRSVQVKISQAITYPYEALQKSWQGTVKLKLRILRDGSLSEATVMDPSGHDIFDQDALNTAKIVAPFAAFPSDMSGEDLVVTVPVVYNQSVK